MSIATTASQATNQSMLPAQAKSELDRFLLLDVRTPAEFLESHIEGSVSCPLSNLDPDYIRSLATTKTSCLVICRSGNRARQAVEKLRSFGLPSLCVLEGGLQAWEASGLPVLRGQKMISLERQVRIAAGTLVFIGSVLGYSAHPAWIGLAAFVGAGLVFAGVTDTCGMAMVIARMPWNNRAKNSTGTSCTS